MAHGEVHSERPKTAIRSESKGGMLIEDFPVKMNTNISFHILRAVVEDLGGEGEEETIN